MKILCGDIGGTKTFLQLVEVTADRVSTIDQQRYPSADYDDFYVMVSDFLANHSNIKIQSACFGVAGPVMQSADGQSATITNLPWQMESGTLASRFKIDTVTLINDFEAVGYGLGALGESDFVTLHNGAPIPHGNQLVIGAGTGLGVAQRIWDGNHYRVIPTEGGHADFAPANERQLALTTFLIHRLGRCSMEAVLSGPGLANIYSFIAEQQHQQQQQSEVYQSIIASADPAAAIAESAQMNQNLAVAAMELFVEAYGTQAGNFALSSLALGGVFIAGGIAPKLIERLQTPSFMNAFRNKGKMSSLMEQMPVRVVMNPEVGLLGSRVIAQRTLPAC